MSSDQFVLILCLCWYCRARAANGGGSGRDSSGVNAYAVADAKGGEAADEEVPQVVWENGHSRSQVKRISDVVPISPSSGVLNLQFWKCFSVLTRFVAATFLICHDTQCAGNGHVYGRVLLEALQAVAVRAPRE